MVPALGYFWHLLGFSMTTSREVKVMTIDHCHLFLLLVTILRAMCLVPYIVSCLYLPFYTPSPLEEGFTRCSIRCCLRLPFSPWGKHNSDSRR